MHAPSSSTSSPSRRRLILPAAGALALLACGPTGSGPSGDDTPGDVDAAREIDAGFDLDATNGGEGCAKIDILFVVDNSGSMAQEQANLATNFPQFISVIEQSGLDYRVAVTTTGVDYTYSQGSLPGFPPIPSSITGGDNGAMLQPASCNLPRRWIQAGDPNPAQLFACAANVGTNGPSDEMPLAAMRAAFDDRVTDGTNAGFRRDDALLAVVILTDENDCSYEQPVTLGFAETLCDAQQEPVANYVAFLDSFTGDRGRWATAVIAGPGPSTCSSTFGDADYAQRLDQFVMQAGTTNGVLSSICAGDLTAGLTAALELFDTACENFPPIGKAAPPRATPAVAVP
ncbi:MAG: VWA domain-containing protein [Myxococcales bacterium]|nr:VWA domain-containing protein [Myxococcales bacterium]